MSSILVVPGLNGSGPDHWQHWWTVDHDNALLVEQQDWSHPVHADWLHRLEAEIAARPDSILVGHSLGAVLIASLAGRPAADHVAGAILVAPSDLARVDELHPGAANFAGMPTLPLSFPTILVASDDDPYLKPETAEELAADWGSGLVMLDKAGHINAAAGFGRWRDSYAFLSAFGAGTGLA